MSARELFLLSPFRLPGKNSMMLGAEDMAAFLNGYLALWHPALLARADGPPKVSSPYDHEQPGAGHVYAAPVSPPLLLPDDWDQRVAAAGATVFRAEDSRERTHQNAAEALTARAAHQPDPAADREPLLDAPADVTAAFRGLGFGYLLVQSLTEAMDHENVVSDAEVWDDVRAAVAAVGRSDWPAARAELVKAADRLVSAREMLYPSAIHLVDVALVEPQHPDRAWPDTLRHGLPCNLVASTEQLEAFGNSFPDRLATLRERMAAEQVEVCSGGYREREDALLPVESQAWNLRHGLDAARGLLGGEPAVFGRKRFWAHPQMPMLLNQFGLRRALWLAFDEAKLPNYRATVVNIPSPDGKQIEAFTRMPAAADQAQTWFNLVHTLHKSISQDSAPTLAFLHAGPTPPAPWYHDLVELTRLAPVIGRWVTLSRYLSEVMAGEYTSTPVADEFHGDYLSERTNAQVSSPVGAFARHGRRRRRLDSARTLVTLFRSLSPADRGQTAGLEHTLSELETRLETLPGLGLGGAPDIPSATAPAADPPGTADSSSPHGGEGSQSEAQEAEVSRLLDAAEAEAAGLLSGRLLSRATGTAPGFMVLNPCGFARRVALEVPGFGVPLAAGGPVKACQVDAGVGKLVVEVPPLGFAWFPRSGGAAAAAPARMKLADDRCVRNEFLEAEIDPATGGLRGLRDMRTRVGRLGQQLVFNPGSTMRADSVTVVSSGPAVGELVTAGVVVGEDGGVLARFRQRFRAWLARPLLDLRIELFPEHRPHGYPWHAYYGARFAWRDERTVLLRGVNGAGYVTAGTRPETPDYLELRLGKQNTVIFPGGLPFHQRHGGRMLDVILVPEGETTTTFDLAIGLDREHPMQTAFGVTSPAPVVPTETGPPHIGAAGWLFHLDASNLLLTGLRPPDDGADAVIARFLETNAYLGQSALRCVRNPTRALLQDLRGHTLMHPPVDGDAVAFEVSPGDLAQLRVDFS